MLAAFCPQIGSLELREIACPQPSSEEALLRVRRCGICGSDLHFYHGPAQAPRVCLGHEIAGEVVAVGAAVETLRVGDRVAVEPLVPCRECPSCRRGDYQLCPRLRICGISRNGGFAEFLAMPATSLYRLPESVDFTVGALAEPLAVGVHALRLARVCGGERVFVLGAGAIGLLAIAAAKAAGAAEIGVTARYPKQAEMARALGASTCRADVETESARGSDGWDLVIETVGGSADTINQAVRLVRPGGQVAVLGVFSEAPRLDALSVMTKEIRLFGSMTYGRAGDTSDFDRALAILAAAPEVFRSLVTHELGLREIGEAFRVAADKRTGCIKVLVAPENG